jgi:DNA-binding MarR family transcriptional regulator
MRQRFLKVTLKGERALARCLPLWRKAHKEFVTTIGAEYWTNLRNELEKLAHVAVRLEESKKESPAAVNVHS